MKVRRTGLVLWAVLAVLLALPTMAGAFTWGPVVGIRSFNGVNMNLEAATDADGNMYAVWNTYPTVRRIIATKFDGVDWKPIQVIDAARTLNNWNPDVAVGPDGNPHYVWWAAAPDNGIFYTRYSSSGWSAPVSTGLPPGGEWPTITVSGTGEVFVAIQSDGIQVARSDGSQWTTPTKATDSNCVPDLSVDANGVVYLAYCNQEQRPAYRTWLATYAAWSTETTVDDSCLGQVKMFHGASGQADLFCLGEEDADAKI